MASYRLTCAAEKDFEAIFDFGIDRFGLDQALTYRRSVYRAHSIYYRIEEGLVTVIRVLGKQKLEEAWSKDEVE